MIDRRIDSSMYQYIIVTFHTTERNKILIRKLTLTNDNNMLHIR